MGNIESSSSCQLVQNGGRLFEDEVNVSILLCFYAINLNCSKQKKGSSMNDVTQFLIIFDTPSPHRQHFLVLRL